MFHLVFVPNNLWVEAGNEENVLQWSQPGSDVNLSFADYTITSLYIHQGNTDGAGMIGLPGILILRKYYGLNVQESSTYNFLMLPCY